MKNEKSLYFVFAFLLMGCGSSSYINQYPSKEYFYENVNNTIADKDIKVVLLNDSTFSLGEGSTVEDDTLFAIKQQYVKLDLALALSDIAKIDYTNDQKTSADIVRKNGEKLDCIHILRGHDSIYFDVMKKVQKRKNIVSADKIKIISYKTTTASILLGVVFGAAIGAIPALAYEPRDEQSGDFNKDLNNSIDNSLNTCCLAIGGPILGGLLGGIIGAVVGSENEFYFIAAPNRNGQNIFNKY